MCSNEIWLLWYCAVCCFGVWFSRELCALCSLSVYSVYFVHACIPETSGMMLEAIELKMEANNNDVEDEDEEALIKSGSQEENKRILYGST